MKLPRRTFLRLAAGASALLVVSRVARAQAYPNRYVRLVGVSASLCGPERRRSSPPTSRRSAQRSRQSCGPPSRRIDRAGPREQPIE